jgi:chaperonin GroEL (HSP60 family)
MLTQELIDEMKEAEDSLGNIDSRLPFLEFMEAFDNAADRIEKLREKACEAVYESTKHVNSRDTIFQVYRHKITSSDLQFFYNAIADKGYLS